MRELSPAKTALQQQLSVLLPEFDIHTHWETCPESGWRSYVVATVRSRGALVQAESWSRQTTREAVLPGEPAPPLPYERAFTAEVCQSLLDLLRTQQAADDLCNRCWLLRELVIHHRAGAEHNKTVVSSHRVLTIDAATVRQCDVRSTGVSRFQLQALQDFFATIPEHAEDT